MTEPLQYSQDNRNEAGLRLKILQPKQQYLNGFVLVRVLNALQAALESFVLATLLGKYSHPRPALKKEIARLAAGMQLMVTAADLKQFSFDFELTPAADGNAFRQLKDVEALRCQLFTAFLNTVFTPDLLSSAHTGQILKQFPAAQRVQIFGPVYNHLASPEDSYQVLFATGKEVDFQTWPVAENKEVWSSLVPEPVKKNGKQGESYYQYLKTGETNDLFGKRSKYEKVLVQESALHDVYPYQVEKIRVKGKTYRFSHTLEASVTVEDAHYRITLPELQLRVSHQDRPGAEKEFDTALARLIGLLESANNGTDAKTRLALGKLRELLT